MLVAQRAARVERPLTYAAPAGMRLDIGHVVRVPLGPRELYGFVVSPPRAASGALDGKLREVAARVDATPAFDATAVALARFVAERYCCTFGEALGAMVLASSIPRTVDRLVPNDLGDRDDRFPSVPPRLVRLIRTDLAEGFTLDALLRHPEARRAGDRKTLLRALGALTRAGALRRERTFVDARVGEATERVLETGEATLRGPRVAALLRRVAEAGELRRAEALLEGFSPALIARAVRAGALRERERPMRRTRVPGATESQAFEATAEQTRALTTIANALGRDAFAEILVQGVTGSGKTFVYVRAIERVLAGGGRAIVLVPEISLTPQTARRFEGAFGDRVAVLHSGLSERERFESWQAAARGEIDVVVGARSAVFAPLPNVRLLVIDEAHERTYKQDGVPRYDTLAVARERMRLAGGTLVLGSATPPLEAYARAERGEIERVVLRARATAQALPTVEVVDMKDELERGNRRIFSAALVDALAVRLARGEKSVLFVNRRGSASFVLCRTCGAVPECDRCSLSLVAHRVEGILRCHLCDAQRPLPQTCPACGSPTIREFGVGTQKVEATLAQLYPNARVVRMDGDTTTRLGDHARLLDEFGERGDVLVGTQMVAKGLDFPTVTLVGVVAADIGLHSPDFRAAERTFDLLTQVAGRSGRARPGVAIVQTYSPAHPAVRFAAQHDFEGFAREELEERRALRYPPFGELIYLGIIGRDRRAVRARAKALAAELATRDDVEVLGPAPFAVARANDEWRDRIALRGADLTDVRRDLRERVMPALASDRDVRLAVNVDP